jgi:hypothetical protein
MLGPFKETANTVSSAASVHRTLVEQFVFMKQTAAAAFHKEFEKKGDER